MVWAKGKVVELSEPKKTRKRKRKGNIKEVEEPKEVNRAIIMWDDWYLGKDKCGKFEGNPQLMTLLKTNFNTLVKTAL